MAVKTFKPFIVICLCLAVTPAFAEIGEIEVHVEGVARPAAPVDHSTLWLKTGTQISSLLIDDQGHRTGVDPETFQMLQEIPGSTCEAEFTANPYTGDEHAGARERLILTPARKGAYRLELRGLQSGPFAIKVNSLSVEGSSLAEKNLEGVITAGEKKILKLIFDPAPNSEITLLDVTNAQRKPF